MSNTPTSSSSSSSSSYASISVFGRRFLELVPADLAIDPNVVKEFLSPPKDVDEWFARRAYVEVVNTTRSDPAMNPYVNRQLEDLFDKTLEGFQEWVKWRDKVSTSDKPGEISIPRGLGAVSAVNAIHEIELLVKSVADQAEPATAATLSTLEAFTTGLWSYVGCMALEADAAASKEPVVQLLSERNAAIPRPWTSAMTPQNVTRNWTPDEGIGANRDPFSVDNNPAVLTEQDLTEIEDLSGKEG
jgi:hypothetical protein